MTRKDCALIAGAMDLALTQAKAIGPQAENAVANAIEHLTNRLAMDNERFDRASFLRACGIVKMKTVRNLMSGKEIEIAEDTPLGCDPSSETYWSM